MLLSSQKPCLDLGRLTEPLVMRGGPISLLPLRSEASIRARLIVATGTEAFPEPLSLVFSLFQTFLLVWSLGLPV